MAREKVDLYDSTYSDFEAAAQRAVRQEAFGEDIGQNSWLTADEYRRFIDRLGLRDDESVLDVGCGSGGPALFLARATGCQVTGVDVNLHGITGASETARAAGLAERSRFIRVDANDRLPMGDAAFDAITCIDAINHFADRRQVLGEWYRVLKPGGRALYVDPVIVSGILTNEEIAQRSSIGHFEFTPVGENERLIRDARFEVVEREDVTENVAVVSKRWHDARAQHRQTIIRTEGEERFDGLQRFFAMVHKLSAERRLSRHAFLIKKAGPDR